jgi:hypothetical protein
MDRGNWRGRGQYGVNHACRRRITKTAVGHVIPDTVRRSAKRCNQHKNSEQRHSPHKIFPGSIQPPSGEGAISMKISSSPEHTSIHQANFCKSMITKNLVSRLTLGRQPERCKRLHSWNNLYDLGARICSSFTLAFLCHAFSTKGGFTPGCSPSILCASSSGGGLFGRPVTRKS